MSKYIQTFNEWDAEALKVIKDKCIVCNDTKTCLEVDSSGGEYSGKSICVDCLENIVQELRNHVEDD